LFYNKGKDIITKIIVPRDVVGEMKRKFKQFVAFFGFCPLTHFKMKMLFQFLTNTPKTLE
jgi:hypothetical protein